MEGSLNEPQKLYAQYSLSNQVGGLPIPCIVSQSFITYARTHYLADGAARKRQKTNGKTAAIGVRFAFELLDNYIGQYCAMFFPHCLVNTFYVESDEISGYARFYYGAMHYLKGLRWAMHDGTMYIAGERGAKYASAAYPKRIADATAGDVGKRVFAMADDSFNHRAAYEYLADCMGSDLCMRCSPARHATF